MNSDLSMTNESFSFLSQSSDFLNMALNNIKSRVLLLDKEMRIAALTSYVDGDEIYNDHIVKPFFTRDKVKVDKHLQFSTRLFIHGREKYIMMIVEDISRWHESSSNLNTEGYKE